MTTPTTSITMSSPAPRWYVAVLLYESSSPDLGYTPLFEEAILLLQAASEDEAQTKAQTHGNQSRTSFKNALGQIIHWSLKHVIDVSEMLVDGPVDGGEIYARHFRDYAAYRKFEPMLDGSVE